MQVDYEDEDLELLAYVSTHVTSRWPPSVTRTFRRRVQQLRALVSDVSEQNLCGLKALQVEKVSDSPESLFSIRIQMQYRLIFRFDHDDDKRLVIMTTSGSSS